MNFDNKAAVQAFLKASCEDLDTSLTSFYQNKIQPFRQTIEHLHELLEGDRMNVKRCHKVLKDLQRAGESHLSADSQFAENLERIGTSALLTEPGIGRAFLKFSVIIKELSSVTKNQLQTMSNMLLFPLTALLQNDFRLIEQDLKRNFDKAYREYDSARARLEKEKRKTGDGLAMPKADAMPSDYMTELERERRMFQLGMCEYLIKANEVRTKKGVDYMQHLLDYYNTHCRLFEDGLKVLHDLRTWADTLTNDLQELRNKQEEEKRDLVELRKRLQTELTTEKESATPAGYSLHIPSGEESVGVEKTGYLWKRSEGIRRVFQKRYCQVKNGHFTMAHSPSAHPTATLTLLTCNVKEAVDTDGKKNCFHLITPAGNRTYVFSAENPTERETWLSVIRNCHKRLLEDKFDQFSQADSQPAVKTMKQLVQGIVEKVKTLPGNDTCCDCGAPGPTWLSHNLGVLTCIECSGIHRDLGVQYSRVVSITLDKLTTAKLTVARAVGNQAFNDIMEANLTVDKPDPKAAMATRKDYIKAKYVDHQFVASTCTDQDTLRKFLVNAVSSKDIFALLQAFGEGVDLSGAIPDLTNGETILHNAVALEEETTLHMVDFIMWNMLDRASINKQDSNGNTPLHIAASQHKAQCVKLLLRGGADVTVVNKDGKTASNLAEEYQCKEAVELLSDAARKKLERCENIRMDWGLEVNKEDEEKIYDEPAELLSLPREDTKFLSVTPGGGRTPKERPYSISTPIGASKPPQRTSSLRDKNSTSPYAQRRFIAPKHGSAENLLSASIASRKKGPPPAIPAPFRLSPEMAEEIKGHRRMISDPQHEVFLRTHRRQASDTLPPPPSVLGDAEGGSKIKRNVSYTKALNDDGQDVVSQKEGMKVNDATQGGGKPMGKTRVAPPPLPTKGKERKPPDLNGCVVTTDPPIQPQQQPAVDHVAAAPGETQSVEPPVHCPTPTRRPEKKKRLKRAKAQFECVADHADELSFQEGEVVVVVQKLDDDWWFGHIEGNESRAGVFPRIYVEEID